MKYIITNPHFQSVRIEDAGFCVEMECKNIVQIVEI